MSELIENQPKISKSHFIFFLIIPLLIGGFLRLYGFDQQVVLDDEWHAYNVAFLRKLPYILRNFHLADNCIPQTALYYLLMKTIGLNEWTFRGLQLFCGILILPLAFIQFRKVVSERVASLVTFLLALSPLHIFYSRMARPYTIMLFLSFISIMCYWQWFFKKNRYGYWAYIFLGAAAVYFHLFSLPSVFICSLFALFLSFCKEAKIIKAGKTQSLLKILLVFLGLYAIIFLLFYPTRKSAGIFLEFRTPSASNWLGNLELLSGSSNYVVHLVFLNLFGFGILGLWKKNKLFCIFSLMLIFAQVVAIFIASPSGLDIPLIFSRYFLPALPFVLLITASGFEYVFNGLMGFIPKKRKKFEPLAFATITVLMATVYFLYGPIPQTYAKVNNFTNHSAYQESYKPIHWNLAFGRPSVEGIQVKKKDIPAFYFKIAEDKEEYSIIEFPCQTGDAESLYYFYQHYHGKKVKLAYPYSPYNEFIKRRINFKNMVEITVMDEILEGDVRYVFMHKDIPFDRNQITEEEVEENFVSLDEMRQNYETNVWYLRENFGEPVFEDKIVSVFEVKRE